MEKLTMNSPKIDPFGWVLIFVLLVFMAVGLFGCATQKKAEKYYKKHPVELAKECADKFPVRDTVLKGDSVFVYDTLWGLETHIDTLISEPQVIVQTKTVTVPKVVTKTITIRDTVIRENTAKIFVRDSQIAKLELDKKGIEVKLSLAEESRDKWRKRFFILLGICVIYTVFRFRSKLGKLPIKL